MASEEADFEVENLCNSIREALTPHPNGLSRERLYAKTEASSLQMLVKAIHRLREAGDVVNITGTPTGPYMLVPDSYKEKQAAKNEVEPEVIPSSGLEGDDEGAEDDPGDASDSPANGSDVHVTTAKLLSSTTVRMPAKLPMGFLRPASIRGAYAYAAYLFEQQQPDVFVSYDILMSRVPVDQQVPKTRASIIHQLLDLGYLERAPDITPARVRWNKKRFAYPFSSKDLFAFTPPGDKSVQPVAVLQTGNQGLAVPVEKTPEAPSGNEKQLSAAHHQAQDAQVLVLPLSSAAMQDSSNITAAPSLQADRLAVVEAQINRLTDSVCGMLSDLRLLLAEVQKLKPQQEKENARTANGN